MFVLISPIIGSLGRKEENGLSSFIFDSWSDKRLGVCFGSFIFTQNKERNSPWSSIVFFPCISSFCWTDVLLLSLFFWVIIEVEEDECDSWQNQQENWKRTPGEKKRGEKRGKQTQDAGLFLFVFLIFLLIESKQILPLTRTGFSPFLGITHTKLIQDQKEEIAKRDDDDQQLTVSLHSRGIHRQLGVDSRRRRREKKKDWGERRAVKAAFFSCFVNMNKTNLLREVLCNAKRYEL